MATTSRRGAHEVQKMLEKDHYCEFEVAEDLIFCLICGKQPEMAV